MRISGLLFIFCRLLAVPATLATTYLYLYPALLGCSFPEAKPINGVKHGISTRAAPFRLLAFGDPQLEGDTSLPDPRAPSFPSLLKLQNIVHDGNTATLIPALVSATTDLLRRDVPKLVQGYRKRLDLWGNDLYLAHIYRSVSWWSQPTHIVVLGDLLGSQWISEDEFNRRTIRFWGTVFKGTEKIPSAITDERGRFEVLGEDKSWERRVIAVAGNHDIGYSGDINTDRIRRFEGSYGQVNWQIRFRLSNASDTLHVNNDPTIEAPASPELRLIILNSMNLDEPSKDNDLRDQSRNFATEQLYQSSTTSPRTSATILLTHIPFHKEAGLCVDGPFFDYFPPDQGGGIKEQNHLSELSSSYILDGLTNRERSAKAIVLNGHDHEGCDTYHYKSTSPDSSDAEDAVIEPSWRAKRFSQARSKLTNTSICGLREITVRSMMGSYGGNAGLLSAWFDYGTEEWHFEYKGCMLGVQHIWWAVHVLDVVVLGLGLLGMMAKVCENGPYLRTQRKMKKA